MSKLFFLELSLKMMNNDHKIFKFRKISKNAHKNRNSAPFRVLLRYLDRAWRELSESVLKSRKIIFRNWDICEKGNFSTFFGIFLDDFSQNIFIQIFFWCFFWNHNKKLMIYSKNRSWPMYLGDFPKNGRKTFRTDGRKGFWATTQNITCLTSDISREIDREAKEFFF